MKVENITLQLSGIDLATIKEEAILKLIEEDCHTNGYDYETKESMNIYLNIEGTAVTAYYVCEAYSGSVRIN